MSVPMSVYDYLHRNGIIGERAKREGRSLSAIEKNIIAAGRQYAWERRVGRTEIQSMEMDGERDWDHVLKPIEVVAVFAMWDAGFEEIPPSPQYNIVKSNHPALACGSTVCTEQLDEAGIKIPKTPTYEAWRKQ